MRFLLLGGYAESLINFRGHLIDVLITEGIEVHVAAPGLSEGSDVYTALLEKGAIPHDVALSRTGTNPILDLWSVWRLVRLMRMIKPDVFLGYTIKPVIYGSLAAKIARVSRRYALITGLGYAFQDDALGLRGVIVQKVARVLYAAALRVTHKVFFQNPDDQALFVLLGLIPTRVPSVVINGSGVDTQYFNIEPLPLGGPRFLMIARLLGAKGVREYAAAATKLRTVYPHVQCALVGWIDDGPDAITQAELDAWVDAGIVDYLGRLSDVRSAIRSCTVYVLPSYREGTPRTVLEAMSMGRPIITTDAPGCRETVIESYNGYLVPPRSVDDLVIAMIRFIEDDGLAERMGEQSRRHAECKYDVQKVNESMVREMDVINNKNQEHQTPIDV